MFAQDGKPKVGSESKRLGVRVAPNPIEDIVVNSDGTVSPATGGMSVAPQWRKLKLHLIPKRLGGRGHDDLVCWRLGDGEFVETMISNDLIFRPDPNPTHGLIQPARSMPVVQYQEALAATRDDWTRDES